MDSDPADIGLDRWRCAGRSRVHAKCYLGRDPIRAGTVDRGHGCTESAHSDGVLDVGDLVDAIGSAEVRKAMAVVDTRKI